jgi:signal transduction histidine kinase
MIQEITDAYALAGAVSMGAQAALHGVAWRRLHRRWCASFAAAYLLGTLVFAFEPLTRPVDNRTNPYATVLGLATALLLVDGMIDYVGLDRRWARRLRAGALGTAAIVLATWLAGWLTRLSGAAVLGGYLGVLALLALWVARREPGSGHGLAFLAMMMFPALVLAAWRGWFPVNLLRYAVIVPTVIFGMTMLTTGLLRAQRQANDEVQRAERAEATLRSLNESLEQRVALRTAELHELVSGLEGFNRQVSHDLRGPLGGIAGASRLADEALQRGDTKTVARMLPLITAQAESSVQLVAALLELARVGEAPFAPKRLALEALVREALAQLHLAAPHSDAVAITVATPLPEVEADPDLLRQVYVNLVGNAMKFSRGASAPRIEVGALEDGGERTFYVRDNGVGFDADRARNLFEPFQRFHDARFPGHGVGLSIVKRIIQRHGGRIWAEAVPGQGATFYFTLGRVTAA